MASIKTVADLVAALLREDQTAPVVLKVAWAGDTAVAKEIDVEAQEGRVHLKGWLPNCDTSLEIEEEVCDECGVVYPEDADSIAGDFHKDSCSLHPNALIGG